MHIEVICTGDEILTGKTINTNFSHISRKLEEIGLSVRWGTTVGDDRTTLLAAFQLAAGRADAVIVNGGLGPTVDDLSQEIAAQAAGQKLVMNDHWLARIEERYRGFGMTMTPNNRKQALLPETAELIDNPAGTACGFALDIGKARFYFTPGVPSELYLMLDQQILPRLLAQSGKATIVRVKRFHTFGIGESRADSLLEGVEALAPDRSVKLGFQTHYPQLETKLTIRGEDADDLARRLEPITAEVRRRLGHFILAEDNDTLEGLILTALQKSHGTLAVVESFTGGLLSARLARRPESATVFRRGIVTPSTTAAERILDLPSTDGRLTPQTLEAVARAAQRHAGVSHALVVLTEQAESAGPRPPGPVCWVAIATANAVTVRPYRMRFGGDDWLRSGAVEMGLDALRRLLAGLPVDEKIDFELS